MSGKDEALNNEEIKIVKTQDGAATVYSSRFDEFYHSTAGSLGESIYVYQKQALEYYRTIFPQKEQIKIFEVGFGAGLNAFVTLVYALDNNVKIDYYTIEKYPLKNLDTDQFSLGDYEMYRVFYQQLHRVPWNVATQLTENFKITKIDADWVDFDLKLFFEDSQIDVVFYDAFSYDKQPEMWTVDVFRHLFKYMSPGAVLTTYAAKGEIKQNLLDAGFFIERLKGALTKRHMLRAIKAKKRQNIFRYIHISNIKIDNMPINPKTLDLAMKIYNGEINPDALAPIRVVKLPQGQYLIRDGRHRVVAFKLNGIQKIKAYIIIPRRPKQDGH